MFPARLLSKRAFSLNPSILVSRSVSSSSANNSNSNVPNVNTSSTTGLEYKGKSSQGKIQPIPGVLDTLTVEQAVSNIIKSTPLAPRVAEERYLIDCLAQDEPGVLSNVTGIMAARGFSIDTLVASKTEVPGLSRMTIGLKGPRKSMEQAKKQLESLVPVWAVLDYSHTKIVERETLLVKVSLDGLKNFRETLSNAEPSQQQTHPHASKFTSAMDRLSAIKNLAGLFRASVVDVGPNSIIVEMSAKSERIDAFLKLVRPFGILEAVRSGVMVMARSIQESRQFGSNSTAEDAPQVVEDLSNLPPS
ncbi:Acetolactate synthase small subunit, mitochondrial [Smittium culicis]|uniref:Acetolactate synthase small subunit, mitochondrial n=1 Tax=Smittium culicis TaxID=133412 RepID=A0A1R1XML3_9FUNG|nr:Acetolactate synthase small subunit, mitochondrial [Smittium culicis]OMJ12334.1 Acetolactate synthase small subunit, mitochondrial [Smittium culicis]OMJ15839.1 Acetolactate synthase small subunit, mitochondrial [Smittium culicis]